LQSEWSILVKIKWLSKYKECQHVFVWVNDKVFLNKCGGGGDFVLKSDGNPDS
jgi:hypothetical protein